MNNTTPPRLSSEPSWQWPSSLMTTFFSLVLGNIFLVHLVFGEHPSVGGDAAGNAMSNAFNDILAYFTLSIITLATILFAIFRRPGFRITMMVILTLCGFMLLTIASLMQI